MALSREGFLDLKPGQVLRSGYGDLVVVRNEPTTSCVSDVPGPREITIRFPDGSTADYGWSSEFGIVNEDWAIDLVIQKAELV